MGKPDDLDDQSEIVARVAGVVGTEIPRSLIPMDHPIVYLTRDVWDDGRPRDVVDVWVVKPNRECEANGNGVLFTCPAGANGDAYCGCYTDAAVFARFGLVPGPDEVIVIDNPWTN